MTTIYYQFYGVKKGTYDYHILVIFLNIPYSTFYGVRTGMTKLYQFCLTYTVYSIYWVLISNLIRYLYITRSSPVYVVLIIINFRKIQGYVYYFRKKNPMAMFIWKAMFIDFKENYHAYVYMRPTFIQHSRVCQRNKMELNFTTYLLQSA